MSRRRSIVIDVLTEAAILAVADELFDREGNLALCRINADDFRFVDFADLDDLSGLINAVTAQLGDMDEAFNAVSDLSECAEFRDLRDLAIDNCPRRIHFGESFPRIGRELLDTEGETLARNIDVEDDGFHFITAFVDFGGIADFLRPADIGDMDETIDAIFDTNEETEIRDVADFALDDRADGVFLFEDFPGIRLGLFHAEADLLVLGVEAQDDDIDHIADVHDAAGVFHATGPAHLADVNQAFDAFFELNKCAVINQADNAAEGADAGRITLCSMFPGIRCELFVTEGNALVLRRELEDLDLDLVADLDDFVRMIDAAPAHVGDVEEAIDAAEVNECTVLGDVLDDTVKNRAFMQLLERLALENCALFFEKRTARKNDVAAFLVELDDLETIFLADEFVEVAGRTELDLAARQECANADINSETAFHAAHDRAFNRLIALCDLGDLFPDHELVSFLLAQDAKAVLVLCRFDIHIDGITDLDAERAIGRYKFGLGHLAFRFVSNINDNIITNKIDNFTADDLTFTNGRLSLLILSKQRLKAFHLKILGHD